MGAEFQTLRLPRDLSQDQVTRKFQEAQASDQYENGHSYSGGIGMADGLEFTTQEFAGMDAAEEWLMANCEKWDAAKAVTVVDDKHTTGFYWTNPITRMHEAQPNDDFGKRLWLIGAWCAS